MIRVAIISSVSLLSFLAITIILGVYTLDVSIYEVVIAIICAAFLWGFGFVISGFIIIREKDIGDIRVRIIKRKKEIKLR